MKRNCEKLVIADFGCGEARLAQALSSTCKQIYSFDLVALNDNITVCDFSKTPLENESIDIAVFCLSLMGTNLRYTNNYVYHEYQSYSRYFLKIELERKC